MADGSLYGGFTLAELPRVLELRGDVRAEK
jgi:hypothetical protein